MGRANNGSDRDERSSSAPPPRGKWRGEYTIYKPVRKGTGGALRFQLNAEREAVFVEGANQEKGEVRRFAWRTKIVMKWGLSDLGEALAVLERRQPQAKLFHQTEKMNTAFELKYQPDRRPANYFATISRQRGDTKEVDRLGISVSPGEASILASLIRHAVVVIAGWDRTGER